MRLFTIGDSISQGFMSLAAARTDLAYSTLIARALGVSGYRYPSWPMGGMPFNLENVMRKLESRYGSNIGGIEWLTALQTINGVVDRSEDYYEREDGAIDRAYPDQSTPFFHNVSVRGFEVADAWLMNSRVCREVVQDAGAKGRKDNFLQGPNLSFYRTARKVLDPRLDDRGYPEDRTTQLDWLKLHAESEGVENLILWLGANNALGTILSLNIKMSPDDPPYVLGLDHLERREKDWNLWHPNDFFAEYDMLLKRTLAALKNNQAAHCHVFLATVPQVTVAPLAKGVGEKTLLDDTHYKGYYYEYYTYFPFGKRFAKKSAFRLTKEEAIHIDDCIAAYNTFIRSVPTSKKYPASNVTFHFVDVAKALFELAWKRNDGRPRYEFPDAFQYTFPKVNTQYYYANRRGKLERGGIVGLDGVHPSAIGQGLIAHEFLKVMNAAGIAKADGTTVSPNDLQWASIFNSDSLFRQPLSNMQEIYQHKTLAKLILRTIRRKPKKDTIEEDEDL